MFPASTTGGGSCESNVSDVCKTPSGSGADVPTPYTNTVQVSTCTNTSSKVLFNNSPAVHINSSMSSSNGDEAGTSGGVVSSVVMSKVAYTQSSSKVYVEGKGCVYHTSATTHNGSSANTTGTQTSPSQTKVQVGT